VVPAAVLLGAVAVFGAIAARGINESVGYLMARALWIGVAAIIFDVARQRIRNPGPARLGLGLIIFLLLILLLGVTVTAIEVSLGRQ
jgi:hypothetical protein